VLIVCFGDVELIERRAMGPKRDNGLPMTDGQGRQTKVPTKVWPPKFRDPEFFKSSKQKAAGTMLSRPLVN
jgi:hypothetical protein